MKILIRGKEYFVPVCFKNSDGTELCSVPECRYIKDCICKKIPGELPSNLGADHKVEAVSQADNI